MFWNGLSLTIICGLLSLHLHHPNATLRHHLIVVYKTAFYSFYLPVALAMRMVGIADESAYKLALSILLPLGEYFQVQDDYLDCYAPPEVLGKIGTDILVSGSELGV